MSISVVEPVQPAIDATRRILFEPFDLGKWFVLGFCAWLAVLGENGASYNWNLPDRSRAAFTERTEATGWFSEHMVLFGLIAGFALLLGIGVMLLIFWISSRGKFMFLDGVLHNRAAVAEPWRRYRSLGNSLLLLRLVVGVAATFFVVILVGGAIVSVAVTGRQAVHPGIGFWILFVLIIGCFSIAFGVYRVMLNDLLVPVMYLRDKPVSEVWPEVRALIADNAGTLALFVLFKVLLAIGIVTISIITVLCTCCIAALPYIGTVVLLPLHVFSRAYPLCFLGQLGGDFSRFSRPGSADEEPAVPIG